MSESNYPNDGSTYHSSVKYICKCGAEFYRADDFDNHTKDCKSVNNGTGHAPNEVHAPNPEITFACVGCIDKQAEIDRLTARLETAKGLIEDIDSWMQHQANEYEEAELKKRITQFLKGGGE